MPRYPGPKAASWDEAERMLVGICGRISLSRRVNARLDEIVARACENVGSPTQVPTSESEEPDGV